MKNAPKQWDQVKALRKMWETSVSDFRRPTNQSEQSSSCKEDTLGLLCAEDTVRVIINRPNLWFKIPLACPPSETKVSRNRKGDNKNLLQTINSLLPLSIDHRLNS